MPSALRNSVRVAPLDLPRDARGILSLPEDLASDVWRRIDQALESRRWRTTQDILFDVKDPEFLAYWIAKTIAPLERGKAGADVEKILSRGAQAMTPMDSSLCDKRVIVSLCGDLMGTAGAACAQDRLYEEVEDLLFDADLSYANLESTLTKSPLAPLKVTGEETPKVNISVEEYKALTSHDGQRFDVLQLANNHVLDCGEEGVETTLSQLRQDGVEQVGVNETAEGQLAPRIVCVRGLRIGWVAHTFSVNFQPIPEGRPYLVNITPFHVVSAPNRDLIFHQISACKKAECDLVVVSLHWGLEFECFPHPDQIAWAHEFAEAGADLVVGHHPHVLQPIEFYQTVDATRRPVPILYSLGNLTPPLSHPACVLSAVARVEVVRSRGRTFIDRLTVTPVVAARRLDGDTPCILPLSSVLGGDEHCEYFNEVARFADLVLGPGWRQAL